MLEQFSAPPQELPNRAPETRSLRRERPPRTLIPEDFEPYEDEGTFPGRGRVEVSPERAERLLKSIPPIEITPPESEPDFDDDIDRPWRQSSARKKGLATMLTAAVSGVFGGVAQTDFSSVESRFNNADKASLELASADFETYSFAEIDRELAGRADAMITKDLARAGWEKTVDNNLPRNADGTFSFTAFSDMYGAQLPARSRTPYHELAAAVRGITPSEQKEAAGIIFDTMYFIPSGAMRAPGSILNPEFNRADRFAGHYSNDEIRDYYDSVHTLIEDLVVGYFQNVDLDSMDEESRRVGLRALEDAADNVFNIEIDRMFMDSLIDRSSAMIDNAEYVFSTSDTGDGATLYDTWLSRMGDLSIDAKLLASQVGAQGGDSEVMNTWTSQFLSGVKAHFDQTHVDSVAKYGY